MSTPTATDPYRTPEEQAEQRETPDDVFQRQQRVFDEQHEAAVDWLRAHLADGAQPEKDVLRDFYAAGFDYCVWWHAKGELGVIQIWGFRLRLGAAVWLRDFMPREGHVPVDTVRTAAAAAGYPWRCVQRAAHRLGIASKRTGFGRGAGFTWSMHAAVPAPGRRRACTEPTMREDDTKAPHADHHRNDTGD